MTGHPTFCWFTSPVSNDQKWLGVQLPLLQTEIKMIGFFKSAIFDRKRIFRHGPKMPLLQWVNPNRSGWWSHYIIPPTFFEARLITLPAKSTEHLRESFPKGNASSTPSVPGARLFFGGVVIRTCRISLSADFTSDALLHFRWDPMQSTPPFPPPFPHIAPHPRGESCNPGVSVTWGACGPPSTTYIPSENEHMSPEKGTIVYRKNGLPPILFQGEAGGVMVSRWEIDSYKSA